MRCACLAVVLAASLVVTSGLTPAQRAKQMLANMNITEKITMVHGASGEYVVRGSGGGRASTPSRCSKRDVVYIPCSVCSPPLMLTCIGVERAVLHIYLRHNACIDECRQMVCTRGWDVEFSVLVAKCVQLSVPGSLS